MDYQDYLCEHVTLLEEIIESKAEEYSLLQMQRAFHPDFRLSTDTFSSLIERVVPLTADFLGYDQEKLPAFIYISPLRDMVFSSYLAIGTLGYGHLENLSHHKETELSSVLTVTAFLPLFYWVLRTMVSDSYYPVKQTILIKERQWTNAVCTLAHEYAHFVQDISPAFNSRIGSFMDEGHALGTGLHIARAVAEQENDSRYVLSGLSRSLGQLLCTYSDLCTKIKQAPKSSFNSLFSQFGHLRQMHDFLSKNSYCVGGTLFTVAEKTYGVDVYKDVLLRPTCFLEV